MASVDVVLPVFNEEQVLERSVRTLHLFLTDNLHHDWRIVIADNGSRDRTPEIARSLSTELEEVEAWHIPEAGRGRALTRAWLDSNADVLAYMDIDLSTDLEAFPRLVSAVADQGNDIAAGTRLGPGTETRRSLKREVLSRGFVLIINLMFGARMRDTQCGFKAINRAAAQKLLPLVKDTGWFWDTELLLLGAKSGWRVTFVPVRWVEDTDSRVKVVSTILKDMKGMIRMRGFDWSKSRKP
ncbi:MAG: glycosyltransferase [Dehalococcoidia bacterium]|nr:glycosyltransferase [Dehalococcoidia bacterium]